MDAQADEMEPVTKALMRSAFMTSLLSVVKGKLYSALYLGTKKAE